MCQRPVGLIDLFPTISDYLGLPPLAQWEGISFVLQLRDVTAPHPPVIVTMNLTDHYGPTWANNHAIVSDRYRYIRYRDGAEEFYNFEADPREWQNLAGNPEYRSLMDEHAKYLPKVNAPGLPKDVKAKSPKQQNPRQDD